MENLLTYTTSGYNSLSDVKLTMNLVVTVDINIKKMDTKQNIDHSYLKTHVWHVDIYLYNFSVPVTNDVFAIHIHNKKKKE